MTDRSEQDVVTYQLEPALDVDEFVDVLVRSTLAERRPVDRRDIVAGMLARADIILTARIGSAPAARTYYPHIGMQPHDSAWIIPRRP